MPHPTNANVRIYFGALAPLAARINKSDGTVAVAADVSTIAYSVEQAVSGQNTGTGTLTPIATYIDDTPSSVWSEHTDPPNFNWDAPAALFDEANATYWVAVTYTFVGGFVDKQVWEVETMPVEPV